MDKEQFKKKHKEDMFILTLMFLSSGISAINSIFAINYIGVTFLLTLLSCSYIYLMVEKNKFFVLEEYMESKKK